jgi:hypothetical protein
MHKSKLAGFIIDCQGSDPKPFAEFWSQALGMPMLPLPGTEGERYVQLESQKIGLHIEVQAVDHPSRVHLDIESDDIEAEALRLEKLGAKRIKKIHTWQVMEAPSGQRFCIVRAQSRDFAERATTWPD